MLVFQNGLFVICTLYCVLSCFHQECLGYHILNSSIANNRIRRETTTCGSFTFKCTNGLCIKNSRLCDGKVDCPDGSDETLKCSELASACPDYAYKCAYGACVDGDARCNGQQDCADNSDEIGCINATSNPCGNKFTCKSGQCINRYLLCDGAKDCKDGSDETFENCNGIACQEFSYRCAYGACVDGDAKCNGVEECADGSDESPQICGGSQVTTTTPPSRSDGPCTFPPKPNHGSYSVKEGQGYSILTFTCASGRKLYPSNYKVVICEDGQWLPGIPACPQICAPRISDSVETYCELDGIKQDCSMPMVEGTTVRMSCKHLYKQIDGSSNPESLCKDGTWDHGFIKCVPECGKIVPEGTPLIVGGESVKKGSFPWHVGIYRLDGKNKYQQKCGGSIVSKTIVISAAHCFTNHNNGQKFEAKEFAIGAGKYYRDYYNESDSMAQKRTIKKIVIPQIYKGELSSFGGDIAFVELDEALLITHVVQPVCIDWNTEFEVNQLRQNNEGVVVGWGFIEQGTRTPSIALKQLRVPYVDLGNCQDVVPENFYRFLTQDKFCAGFTNGSSVCHGDSGGGLVFYWSEQKKYYLRGLVSVGPIAEGSCDSKQYGAYTKVSNYMDQLRRVEISTRT